jgi:hypothetical protein
MDDSEGPHPRFNCLGQRVADAIFMGSAYGGFVWYASSVPRGSACGGSAWHRLGCHACELEAGLLDRLS